PPGASPLPVVAGAAPDDQVVVIEGRPAQLERDVVVENEGEVWDGMGLAGPAWAPGPESGAVLGDPSPTNPSPPRAVVDGLPRRSAGGVPEGEAPGTTRPAS